MSIKNITVCEDGSIIVKNVVLSYPHVFEPWAKNPEKEKLKYSCKGLLPETTHAEAIKYLKGRLSELQMEYFKAKVGTANLFLRNGNDSGKAEQEGHWVISASENVDNKPDVFNRDMSPINPKDGILYAGCIVNIKIKPWKQDNSWGKKVNANLLAVQYVGEGTRFGTERPDTAEGFETVEPEFKEGAGDDSDWDN
jgi:hypothetical protein